MALITEQGNPSNSYTVTVTVDDFIPVVKFENPNKQSNVPQNSTLVLSNEDANLSEYIEKNIRSFKILELTTSSKEFSLPFEVIKGVFSESFDGDGYITTKLIKLDAQGQRNIIDEDNYYDTNVDITRESLKKELEKEIRVTSEKSFLVDINKNSKFKVDIEVNTKESAEYYLEFYAYDNVGEKDKAGNIGDDVLCGRFKIVFEKPCVCQDTDWPTLASLVKESEKVKYNRTPIPWTKDTPECYHYALHQLKVLGYWIKSERWNKKWKGTKELNDHIYQLDLDADVAGMKKGAQKTMFKKSLIYLKQAMKGKVPVMVGLNYKSDYANDDLTTDHFAVITGCGKDSNDKLFFHVIDNAFKYQKYYCNCENFEIKSEDNRIVISQVRESKKL